MILIGNRPGTRSTVTASCGSSLGSASGPPSIGSKRSKDECNLAAQCPVRAGAGRMHRVGVTLNRQIYWQLAADLDQLADTTTDGDRPNLIIMDRRPVGRDDRRSVTW